MPVSRSLEFSNGLSHASIPDTFRVLRDVILPTLAKGPLIRRRKVVGTAERNHVDDRAVLRLQKLRGKYGSGPLRLRVPFRRQVVLLSPDDVRMVLEHSPETFSAATLEKRSALDHFEPNVVLASEGHDRAQRRTLNEDTLETGCPMHSMAAHFDSVAREEMAIVSTVALQKGRLEWDDFFAGWYRIVRRIVLGDAARDDEELTDLLEALRRRANYAFMAPKAHTHRERFLDQLRDYLATAEAGSLAGQMESACTDPVQMPEHQLPQYLFAFDPAGMAIFRTLALLSVHPDAETRARAEIAAAGEAKAAPLPFLQACFLESLRLWPTTPVILRETKTGVHWAGGTIDPSTHIIIFAPFFHRDNETLPQAHVFDPSLWDNGPVRADLGLVPFSAGPVVCPARHLVPMVASFALRHLLDGMVMSLNDPERINPARLPGTLDNYTLDFAVRSPP